MTESPVTPPAKSSLRRFWRGVLLALGFVVGLSVIGAGALGWWAWHTWQGLPSIKELAAYQPAQPLRIYATDGTLLAEYGQERRDVLPLAQIPQRMQQALLAIEDARFYEHGAVDFSGLARAAVANVLTGRHGQGGSTISMQVARNFYLTREKTVERKLTEMLLAFKLEQEYGKDRLLELYMNQVYLGERAYGFAAAANIYFGKPISQISVAEAAMLAGLPKAPSAYNPVANPERAKVRQQYILKRMHELGYLTDPQYQQALAEPLELAPDNPALREAAYPVEAARRWALERYGDDVYAMGLDIHTTLNMSDQRRADAAMRSRLLDLQASRGYRGPVKTVNLPADGPDGQTVRSLLSSVPDSGDDVIATLVTGHQGTVLRALRRDGSPLDIATTGITFTPANAVNRGAIVYARDLGNERWQLAALPEMEGALVSLDARNGDILALVGGFDFARNKYDHALQAYRQPGSSFKPFIYSAALEKGYFPGTEVDDTQRLLTAEETGARPWRPKNYSNNYEGFITVRRGLARSKNLVSVSLMQAAGPQFVQQHAVQFGFDAARNPPSLPLALGAGGATPLQMASSYAVFANGGIQVPSRLIKSVNDRLGKVLYAAPVQATGKRVVSARNAWLMDSMLRGVVSTGTAHSAKVLGRDDLAGKTGTSNNARDAWFAGYGGNLVSVVWVGYDQPRSLGGRTGGTVSLPIWIDYMKTALAQREPVPQADPPAGLVQDGDDFVYSEYTTGTCVADDHDFIRSPFKCQIVNNGGSANVASAPAENDNAAQEAERETILKLFSNDG